MAGVQCAFCSEAWFNVYRSRSDLQSGYELGHASESLSVMVHECPIVPGLGADGICVRHGSVRSEQRTVLEVTTPVQNVTGTWKLCVNCVQSDDVLQVPTDLRMCRKISV